MINIYDFMHETFLPITENAVPGIEPNSYCISNWGRVWSNKTNAFRTIGHYTNGYCKVSLYLADRSEKTISIHRLVAMTFNPVPNMNELEVNHIDGNKENNAIWNLEWMSHYDNMAHARITGLLNNLGENSANATFTNEQVHLICKMLSDNIHYKYILKALGLPETKQNMSKLVSIRLGQRWAHISSQYDLSGYVTRNPRSKK